MNLNCFWEQVFQGYKGTSLDNQNLWQADAQKPCIFYHYTLRLHYKTWFNYWETVLLLGPVPFQKYEAWLLIGSILNFEALLGAP